MTVDATRCDDAGPSTEAGLVASRFDAGTIGKLERTPTGGVRVPARVTRTGVLVYRRADGSTVREYRPEAEVFRPDSLATLADAAVTVAHPVGGKVTPESFRADSVGYVREAGRRDGRFVAATLAVQDAQAIARIDARELVELSCGYSCTVDPTPGTTPDGERYDAIQKNIKYNHVALLPPGGGRAGREVALRVDGAAVELSEPTTAPEHGAPSRAEKRDDMKTERIDGIEYEIGSVAWAQARERHDAKVASDLAAATKAAEDATKAATEAGARADAAEKRAKALEAELAPERLDARVAERAALIEKVRPVLGAEKLDGKSDLEIMQLAIGKLDPEFKLDAIPQGERDVYVRARFAAEIRHAKSPVAQARAALMTPAKADLSAYLVKPGDRI